MTLAEAVALAEKLAEENGGKIPRYNWLVKNGYGGLANRIPKNADSFAHLEQDRKRDSIGTAVVMAEKLTKANGGVLPSGFWMSSNGYHRLVVRISKHPQYFAHLNRKGKK